MFGEAGSHQHDLILVMDWIPEWWNVNWRKEIHVSSLGIVFALLPFGFLVYKKTWFASTSALAKASGSRFV